MQSEGRISKFFSRKIIGLTLITLCLVALLVFLYPMITAELEYIISSPSKNERVISPNSLETSPEGKYIIPVDKSFGLIIPKINTNVSVVKDVDPLNSYEYQAALAKGVAHSITSSTPDKIGNTFIFSHSSVDFISAQKYNSVLYLLHKLKEGDAFYLTYENMLYKYNVVSTAKVSKDAVEYMEGNSTKRQVTLMTCWPPGTDLKRLIVVGELESIN